MKMKMNKLMMAAVAATMLFASCSNEENASNNATGEKATLTVNIAAPQTRAGVASLPNNTMVVTDYFVVVTDGTNIIATKDSPAATALTIGGADGVTTAAAKVYVVANLGMTGTSYFSATDLSSQTNFEKAVKTTLSNGLIASGSATVSMVAADPTVLEANPTITFVKSRITLSLILQDENGNPFTPAATDELILTDVAVLNAYETSKFYGTTLYDAANTLYHGITTDVASPFAPTASETTLTDVIGAGVAPQEYVYYVTENDNITTTPTILTVVAKWNGNYRYYPVHFTAADALKGLTDQKIKRGKSYDITMTLKGKWSTGGGGTGGTGGGDGSGEGTLPGGGGVEDPKVNLLPAAITVTVSVTNWTPEVINKIFD